MTIYYLSSVDGSDASDGLSWDNAFATFKYGVETASAAASGPHLLYVDNAHSESLSADTTITAAGDLRILCVNRSTGALATTAVVGAQSNNYAVTLAGAFDMFCYGIEFKNGTSTTNKSLWINTTEDGHYEFESCKFTLSGTSASNVSAVGGSDADGAFYTKFRNSTFSFANASQQIRCRGGLSEFVGCDLNAAGTAPTALFGAGGLASGIKCEGCDWSFVGSNTLVGNTGVSGQLIYEFANCKFGSGMTIKAAAATVLNKANTIVTAFNCDAGDNHYALYHADAFGETTVSATIYANDGASYDGSNRCSWKIVTTANCSYYTPYVSPWMDVYHSGTSAISPYLEILRSGSTTKYQNDEVWGEFSYQGTSGSTKATIVNDRMTLLGTAADQTASSLDASGWTGEDATNNSFMKLEAGSITPAEIGHIRARVCVGEPSITVYVDPKIRGLS